MDPILYLMDSTSKGRFQKRFSGFCPLRGYKETLVGRDSEAKFGQDFEV